MVCGRQTPVRTPEFYEADGAVETSPPNRLTPASIPVHDRDPMALDEPT